MVVVAPAPAKAAKKQRVNKTRTGPGLSDRIVTIVSASNERGGVSGSAIKKALTAGGYDVERNRARVKLTLRTLVLKGTLIQVRGSGASGSFKISKKATEPKTVKVKKLVTRTKKSAAKKPAVKKTTKSPKKTTKSPKKTTKATKSPKKTTKSPKKSPKKTTKRPKMVKSPKKGSKKTLAARKSPVKRVSKPKTTKAAPKKK